jgi:hypothetical protein
VHVGEDRRNGSCPAGGADVGWRLGIPGGRIKMFDKNLVHAIVGGKDLDCGSAELSVNLGLTRGHGSLLLDLSYFRAFGCSHLSGAKRHADG